MRHIPHWPLAVILLVYFLAGVTYSAVAPFLDVSDEVRHYAMIEHLAQGNGLPVQDPALNQRLAEEERQALRPLTYYAQEGSQPPLYYALGALIVLPFDRTDFANLAWPNPHAKLGRADATNNINQLLHTPAEALPWRGTALAAMALRFIGVLLGAATVACTYFLADELRRANSDSVIAPSGFLPPLAASLVAFNPMFVHIMASVNNDTLATALSTLALLLGARMIRRGATITQAALLGIVLGGAALTKASGLALAIVVPFFVLVSLVVRGEARNRALPTALAVALPIAAIAGWWYVRNWQLYGDPTGTTMMARIAGAREAVPSPLEIIGEWDGFFKAYWGLFGAVNIPMDAWIYRALEIVLILAGIGLLMLIADWVRNRRSGNQDPGSTLIALMLLSAFLVAFVALIRWTSLTLASQGRLLFPVIAPISIFIAIGLLRLASAFGPRASPLLRRAAGVGLPIALAALTLLAPFAYIQPAYAAPARLASESALPADLARTELFFGQGGRDDIRWIGYRVNTPGARVAPGEALDVTLYWQALRPLERNYSAFIRVYGRDGVPVHVLDTYPGGGMAQTTLWRPGEIIADRYRLRSEDAITTARMLPTVLRLDAGFWDFTSKQFLDTRDGAGQPTGRQRYEVASLNVPARAGGATVARLARAEVTRAEAIAARDAITLSVDWRATADFGQDYTTFVQLFDALGAKLDPQADGRALGGDFAPRWWRAGDVIAGDEYVIPLPAGLPAGEYTVKFGLYAEDGTRMPAFDASGTPIPDAAISVPVTIP